MRWGGMGGLSGWMGYLMKASVNHTLCAGTFGGKTDGIRY